MTTLGIIAFCVALLIIYHCFIFIVSKKAHKARSQDDTVQTNLQKIDAHELLCDNCIKHDLCIITCEDCHTYRQVGQMEVYIKHKR